MSRARGSHAKPLSHGRPSSLLKALEHRLRGCYSFRTVRAGNLLFFVQPITIKLFNPLNVVSPDLPLTSLAYKPRSTFFWSAFRRVVNRVQSWCLCCCHQARHLSELLVPTYDGAVTGR